jgi:hypothetical protein
MRAMYPLPVAHAPACNNGVARLLDTEDICQAEIRAALIALGVQACLKGGKQRAAGIDVSP